MDSLIILCSTKLFAFVFVKRYDTRVSPLDDAAVFMSEEKLSKLHGGNVTFHLLPPCKTYARGASVQAGITHSILQTHKQFHPVQMSSYDSKLQQRPAMFFTFTPTVALEA